MSRFTTFSAVLLALSTVLHAETLSNSIAFITSGGDEIQAPASLNTSVSGSQTVTAGNTEMDFKYIRRVNGFEFAVNPGLFSLIRSALTYSYRRTFEYSPAVYVAYNFSMTEFFSLKPEYVVGYEYSNTALDVPTYGGAWLPQYDSTAAGTGSETFYQKSHGFVNSLRMNFDFRFDRIHLGFYPGYSTYGWTQNTPNSLTNNNTRGVSRFTVYGIYSGMDF